MDGKELSVAPLDFHRRLSERRATFGVRFNAFLAEDLRAVAAASAAALPTAVAHDGNGPDSTMMMLRDSIATDLRRFTQTGVKNQQTTDLFWQLTLLLCNLKVEVKLDGFFSEAIWNYMLNTRTLIMADRAEAESRASGRISLRQLAREGDSRRGRSGRDTANDVADVIAESVPSNNSGSSSGNWFSRWWDSLFSGNGGSRSSGGNGGGGGFWDSLF